MVEKVKANGGKVTRDAGPVKGGSIVIAFVEDPDGYRFELLERKQRDPVAQVSLRCGDLDKSINFYRDALGMNLIRVRDVPEYKYSLAFLGYGPEEVHSTHYLSDFGPYPAPQAHTSIHTRLSPFHCLSPSFLSFHNRTQLLSS